MVMAVVVGGKRSRWWWWLRRAAEGVLVRKTVDDVASNLSAMAASQNRTEVSAIRH